MVSEAGWKPHGNSYVNISVCYKTDIESINNINKSRNTKWNQRKCAVLIRLSTSVALEDAAGTANA